MAVSLGDRTVVALTCLGCGLLKAGHEFGRHRRNARDKAAYIDRRCRACKWKLMEASAGR